MVKPLSKNSKCSCGSGKKYRKCCRKGRVSAPNYEKVIQIFQKKEKEKQLFEEKYGHARPPISVKMDGKVLSVVGGSIYMQTREGRYTFLHLLHDHALLFFGTDYLEQEEGKPLELRHPAIQWMQAYVDHSQETNLSFDRIASGSQIGASAAWGRFAYDLFTIRDNVRLESRLKKRLLTIKDFQSARHELWVAALCVAAGFDIEFEDESDNSNKHPEFIAIDRKSSIRIAVEAKSRHRRGIKGFSSGSETKIGERVDIRGIVLDAYKKSGDIPLYVFIDVNLPPVSRDDFSRWLGEIDSTMNDLATEGYADPCPANIVFFNNDPSHFLADSPIGNESDDLWIKYYEAKNPKIDHPNGDICGRLLKAHQQRVSPPADFPMFD